MKEMSLEEIGLGIIGMFVGQSLWSKEKIMEIFAEYMKDKEVEDVIRQLGQIPDNGEDKVRKLLTEAKNYKK